MVKQDLFGIGFVERWGGRVAGAGPEAGAGAGLGNEFAGDAGMKPLP